ASVEREVRIRGALVLSGQESYQPPHRMRLEIDGKHVLDLPRPVAGKALPRDGRVPFDFVHRFRKPGSHLVSVVLEPDPPRGEQPRGYVPRDRVPGDNRQDFSVEVIPNVPVLIVDGETGAKPRLGSDFIRDALSPARDRTPSVKARVVLAREFNAEALADARAVVLHDVARLDEAQSETLSAFVSSGGGVLVLPGVRAEPEWHDRQPWMPARLGPMAGDESKRELAQPEPESFTHPALDLFRGKSGGLGDARFRRWRTLETGRHSASTIAASLLVPTGKTPFLVERATGAGRSMMCAVPLDASFGSNLPDLPAFVPLCHELAYWLAGARSTEFNLAPGQPLRARLEPGAGVEQYALSAPGAPFLPLSTQPGQPGTHLVQRADPWLVFDGTRASGVYALRTPKGETVHYVVPADAREADLEPLSEEDRAKVSKLAGLEFAEGDSEAADDEAQRQDLWLWLLLGLVGLLCLEVWMTRRLVLGRE
ncbi:MAG: hypothetical protein K2W96_19375, partial [Gemmataceae bacterium]|nr:hypothetical protein [Gemmataceae bacterium]